MLLKIGIGGAAMFIAAAYYSKMPSGDPGDTPAVAAFKTQCLRATQNVSKPFCRCIVSRFSGDVKTDEEHLLAAGIIRAIGITMNAGKLVKMDAAANRESLQAQFDKLSNEYQGRVSVNRKQAVLHAVTSGTKACAPHLEKPSV